MQFEVGRSMQVLTWALGTTMFISGCGVDLDELRDRAGIACPDGAMPQDGACPDRSPRGGMDAGDAGATGDASMTSDESLERGADCLSDDACASGFCVDNVCCDSACNGTCKECASGECVPVARGDDADTCSEGMTCISGACVLPNAGSLGGACLPRSMCYADDHIVCSDGSCICDANRADCNGDPSDGCEINLQTSSSHCGSCGYPCAGSLVCSNESCQQVVNKLALAYKATCTLLNPSDSNDARALSCWGSNTNNLLRDPDVSTGDTGESFRAEPDSVEIGAVRDVAIGRSHACALDDTSDDVMCWGVNHSYQLGVSPGTTTSIHDLHRRRLAGTTSLAAGAFHTCALQNSGAVRCWGSNTNGQLGAGSDAVDTHQALTVRNLSDATQISSAGHLTCTRRKNGMVQCWGGAFGDPGTLIGSEVGNTLNDAEQVKVGGFCVDDCGAHACAVRANGKLVCWGSSNFGELGNNSAPNPNSNDVITHYVPVESPAGVEFVDVAAGVRHTCALDSEGQVYCWGLNGDTNLLALPDDAGTLVDGTRYVLTPMAIPDVPGVIQDDVIDIEAAEHHTCARRRSGQVVCWGMNDKGQLGDGTSIARPEPVKAKGLP